MQVARHVKPWDRVEGFLIRSLHELVARVGEPLSFRFIVQPLVAAVLATRAGLGDARANRPPFLWTLVTRPSERGMLLRSAWQDIARLSIVALVVDAAFQLFVLRWFYPLQAVLVAALLAVVPYVLIRGPVSRLAKARRYV